MIEYGAHTWADVVESFREHEAANPYLTPLRAFVEQVAASRYSAGLFPLKVMHTVRLFQHERFSDYDDEIWVDFEEGEFVVRYYSGGGPRPLWGPQPPRSVDEAEPRRLRRPGALPPAPGLVRRVHRR